MEKKYEIPKEDCCPKSDWIPGATKMSDGIHGTLECNLEAPPANIDEHEFQRRTKGIIELFKKNLFGRL